MGDWILHNLFWVFRGIGSLVFFFLIFIAVAAVRSVFKRKDFRYPVEEGETVSLHIFLWLVSLFSVSTYAYGPDDDEKYWTLRSVEYDDFLLGFEFSLIIHLVLADLIFGFAKIKLK